MQRVLSFFVFLLALSPGLAAAQTLECTTQNEVNLHATVARLVGALKVGQYRADAALLESNSGNLDALLASCDDVLKVRLCDAECQYQRASVRLFKATGLPLLSSRGSSSPGGGVTPPGDLIRYADEGVAIVDDGIRKLPRQQVIGDAEAQRTQGFNAYLKSLAVLSGLKVRLLMASGDAWYRDASVSQVARLAYLTSENVPDDRQPTGLDDAYSKAITYYDQAFWLLMEARGSLPVSNLFAAESSTLASLDRDISARLSSVRKGQLYIGIDPDDMTYQGIDALGHQLALQRDKLNEQEKQVADLLDAWQTKYKDLQDKQFDVTNMAHARAIDNEVYKIAQLDDQATLLKAGIQGRIDAVQSAQSTFDRERQIRALQTALVQRKMELQNDIRVVQQQKEMDLLVLDKENLRDGMDNYRFNIDMTLAAYNFRMQFDSLTIQIAELDGRIVADNTDIAIADRRNAQLAADVALESQRIAATAILIQRYRTQQSTVQASEALAITNERAAVQAELDWYNRDAADLAVVCAARDRYGSLQKEEIAKLKACIESSCPDSLGLKPTIEIIRQQNAITIAAQRKTIQDSLNLLRQRNVELAAATALWAGVKTVQAAAEVASAAAAVSAAVPRVTVGVIGPFPVAIVNEVDSIAETAKAIADATSRAAEWAAGNVQFLNQVAQEVNTIQQQTVTLQGELTSLDNQQLLDIWTTQKALAEVNVQLLSLGREDAEAAQQRIVQQFECARDKDGIEGSKSRLRATLAALTAQLQAKTQETSLLDYDIQQQQNLRGQSEIALRRLTAEREQIALEQQKIVQDINNINDIKNIVQAQKIRVQGFQSQVENLKSAYEQKRALLADVQAKITAQTIKIPQEQAAYISRVIESEDGATSSQIADLRHSIALIGQEQALNAEMTQVETSYRTAIVAARNNILDLAAKSPTNDSSIAIFWDFEELTAELTRGAAEILEQKRILIENINFTYNLYRNRYNMLTSFVDVSPIGPDQTFVRTADDVTRALGDCSGLGTNAICSPKSLVWSKATIRRVKSDFIVEQNSGLMDRLVRDGRVTFEVSPFGRSATAGPTSNALTMWDDPVMTDKHPMTLINIIAGAQGSACRSQTIGLRHLGIGVQFRRLTDEANSEIIPTLMSKAPTQPIVNLPVWGDDEVSLWTQEMDRFRLGNAVTAVDLEQRMQTGGQSYPFVGYPVIGSYELVADENLVRCLASGSPSLKLGFIYAIQ